jgi:uncharacterized protein
LQITREASARNTIRAWETGRIRIGEEWINGHLIVAADRIVRDWAPSDPARPAIDDLELALELDPEIIVVGIADPAPVPDIELMASLASRAIGLEFMSMDAACRTFNVLVHEDRRVVAVLCQDASATLT